MRSPGSVTPELRGSTEPRLWTPPRRELTRDTSLGFELADFADQVLGRPLLPWQRWLAVHALELDEQGGFRFRTVVVLVARQNGKTSFLTALGLWRLFLDGARLVLGMAQDLDVAREAWLAAVDLAESSSALSAELGEIRRANGQESLPTLGGGRWKIKAPNRKAGRGPSVDLLLLDELREWTSWAPWSAASKTTQARARGQIVCFSNAGDDQSVVLNHLRDAALSGRDGTVGVFEWSAEDGCDLDDRSAWAQANPSLGIPLGDLSLTAQTIAAAMETDPPEVFRTEVLCQRVDTLDVAVDQAGWRACADASGSMASLRDRVVACVDVAPDGGHVTLAVAAMADDGRVRTEIVQAWASTRDARTELADVVGRVSPHVLAWYPSGPAAALGSVMRDLEAVPISGQQVNEACQQFADLVTSRQLIHPSDPLLDAHVAGASRKPSGDGWRFARLGVGHVDAVYAAAGAVQQALAVGIPYDVLESVF